MHIDDVVENALGANPEERYPTARDMVNDIQRVFSNELDVVATGPNLRNIMVGTGAGLIVLMLAGIYIANREQPDPRENARVNDHQIRAEVADLELEGPP